MFGRIKKVYATDIVAVAYSGSEIPSFEKADAYMIYAVDEDKVRRTQILSIYSRDIDEVIEELKFIDCNVIICKNYGPKALAKLKKAELEVYDFNGGAKAAVLAFARQQLKKI